MMKNRKIKSCYLFDCPCCINCYCTITREEYLYLYENHNTYCIAVQNGKTFLDFKNSSRFRKFKEFHESLKILKRLNK